MPRLFYVATEVSSDKGISEYITQVQQALPEDVKIKYNVPRGKGGRSFFGHLIMLLSSSVDMSSIPIVEGFTCGPYSSIATREIKLLAPPRQRGVNWEDVLEELQHIAKQYYIDPSSIQHGDEMGSFIVACEEDATILVKMKFILTVKGVTFKFDY